jgi:hypothetical protein
MLTARRTLVNAVGGQMNSCTASGAALILQHTAARRVDAEGA